MCSYFICFQPCGTGALDGGHERSQNFKKVLDVFFAGEIPQVASVSASVADSESISSISNLTGNISSTKPSTSTLQAVGDKWYPDYNPIWAQGLCSNALPAPTGRPQYDSHSECCAKAYGGQASGACVGSLSVSTEDSLSSSKPFIADANDLINNPSVALSINNEEKAKWYPDYNPIWTLGVCSNIAPVPIGRPSYNSQSECCQIEYGGQVSGACAGFSTSAVIKSESYYPDYNGNWSLGKCTNAFPAPSGRPQYSSHKECCEKAYAGQSSGACVEDLTVTPTTMNALEVFYPDYNPIWALGVCSNKSPVPQGRPTYSSQDECCNFAYRGQSSGACVNNTPGDKSTHEPISFSEIFMSEFMAPHASLRSNFIIYSCDESKVIPYDTTMVDILFNYEVLLPQNVQVKHALPSVKKLIMDSLAKTLNCHITHRRGLRRAFDDILLGFQSVEGSDVIDGEKVACEVMQKGEGETCYPVIGHIAAVLKFEATYDDVQVAKKDILQNIRLLMTSDSDLSIIQYVNDQSIDDVQESQAGNIGPKAGIQVWVTILCCFVSIAVGVCIARIHMIVKSRNHCQDEDEDSTDNSSREGESYVKETARTNSSIGNETRSSDDEQRRSRSSSFSSTTSSAYSDCDRSSDEMYNLHQLVEHNMTHY